MLRGSIKRNGVPLLLCGLTELNVERLKNNMPIKAALSTFCPDMVGDIVIMYGETERHLERTLEEANATAENSFVDPRVDQLNEVIGKGAHQLILTVGLPRSGKSTWAKKQAWPVVNPDSIRLALHGQRFLAQQEPLVWMIARVMVESLFNAGHRRVILDATNITKKRRAEWISPKWETFYKYVNTPVEMCLHRARALNDDEIIPVILRMSGEWEPFTEIERNSLWP
jgi:Predicted kinase